MFDTLLQLNSQTDIDIIWFGDSLNSIIDISTINTEVKI